MKLLVIIFFYFEFFLYTIANAKYNDEKNQLLNWNMANKNSHGRIGLAMKSPTMSPTISPTPPPTLKLIISLPPTVSPSAVPTAPPTTKVTPTTSTTTTSSSSAQALLSGLLNYKHYNTIQYVIAGAIVLIIICCLCTSCYLYIRCNKKKQKKNKLQASGLHFGEQNEYNETFQKELQLAVTRTKGKQGNTNDKEDNDDAHSYGSAAQRYVE